MKVMKRIFAVMICVAIAFSLTACDGFSFGKKKEAEPTEVGTTIDKTDAKAIDKNIPVPVFQVPLKESIVISADTEYVLDGTAVSPDNGEVTYQWYSNTVNSNCGGTYIEGATDSHYTVDTSELGVKYYYVVATNNHPEASNKITGNVARVDVRKAGVFMADEFGGIRLIAEDNTYPTNVLMLVVDAFYYFDANGYITSGWAFVEQYGQYMFFNEYAQLAPNAVTPQGLHTDENGFLIEQVNPFEFGG